MGVPMTQSLRQEIPFSGSDELTQSSPQLPVTNYSKTEKEESSSFYCRSAALHPLPVPAGYTV